MKPRRLVHAGWWVALGLALLPLPGVLAVVVTPLPLTTPLPEPGEVWPRAAH